MLPSAEGALPQIQTDPESPLGRIVSVSGSQAVVLLHPADASNPELVGSAEMGTLIKVETPGSIVLGLVSALTVPVPSQDPTEHEMRIIEIEFIHHDREAKSTFELYQQIDQSQRVNDS